jgi:diguanylate cyclase (GGDEF)-like protein
MIRFEMLIPSRAKRWLLLVALTAAYFVAGKLGLQLAFVHANVTAVWAPTGIAVAAFLILGPSIWPAIYAGALLVNLTIAGTEVAAFGIAAGNTLEGLAGAWLVTRYSGGSRPFEHARHVFTYAAFAALVATLIGATLGVASLALTGLARAADLGSIWITWWLGDAGGALIVAPVILLWWAHPKVQWRRWRVLEVFALLASLVLVSQLVFGGFFPSEVKTYPLEFLCIPFFVWAAFRFGPREAATTMLVFSAIAISGTLLGFGPFARESANRSLLLLQAFLSVAAVTTLVLAAAVEERRRVEARLSHLAETDPLTGLANYRQLIRALEVELSRSDRTGREFTVLLIDLDRLKKVNDKHGHLVGSRALCRVAEALVGSCRNFDTAARFGGDEFALVLPETDDERARLVAARVMERVADDGETPRITVSIGQAVYPKDGTAVEALLGAADRALYQMKSRNRTPRKTPGAEPGPSQAAS